MNNREIFIKETSESHFIKRAEKYDNSSKWVSDGILIKKIVELTQSVPDDKVLDIGIGTGKIAGAFYGKVNKVVGVDISRVMVNLAKKCVDEILLCPAEELPFKRSTFDICVCRQGLQFMDVNRVLPQIFRVLKPKGRVIFCHLTAYGEKDRETAFLIQKLRNPARKNFFLPQDFPILFKKSNFVNIECFKYITRESVNRWIDNGALNQKRMEKIRDIYRNASDDFKKIHNIEFKNGDIFDSMMMLIVKGIKDI